METDPSSPSPALAVIAIPLMNRNYRIRPHDGGYVLLMSQPNRSGGVSIVREYYREIPDVFQGLSQALSNHCDLDVNPLIDRFHVDYTIWCRGKAGVRPHAHVYKLRAEDVGNYLCRIAEQYALAYAELLFAARDHHCTLSQRAPNQWMIDAQDSIDRGMGGRHLPLAVLVRLSMPSQERDSTD